MAVARSNGAPTRRLTSVVFVDIVGSTELAAALGDERWAELLEQYQAVVRVALANTGGEEMDTAGDGVFAVFTDPGTAAVFGCSIGRIIEPLGLRVRVGVHTGTCWVAGEKCSGLTVSIGARIVAAAEPDEVCVSAAVRERLAGDARFDFVERGEAELKGVPGRWTLYSVLANASKGGDRPWVRRFSTQVRSSSPSGASRT
jgi:class 3 adenylate cyclase